MRTLLLATAAGLAFLMGTAVAQEKYPTKPLTLVMPYPAGGGGDVVGRILAESMAKSLGERVVVQNISGSGSVIGSRYVAQAKPDGYTLLLNTIGMAIAPALYKEGLQFDPLKSFEYVGLFAETLNVLVAGKNFPPNNMKELADHIKKNEGKVTIGSAGMGSASHLCAMLLQRAVGTQITMVQYKGTPAALPDILTGRLDLWCDVAAGVTMPYVKSNEVKALVVATTGGRLPSLPNVPTSREVGLESLNLTVWWGLYAPAGTPKQIIERLSLALQAANRDPAIAAQLEKLGTTVFDSTKAVPAALREKLVSESEFWRPVIENAQKDPRTAK